MTTTRRPFYAPWFSAPLLALFMAAVQAQPAQSPTSSAPPNAAAQDTAPQAGGAQESGEELDTVILSDSLHYDDVKKESTFTGNVIMTRGTMTLRADTLVMREDAEGFQFGTATVSNGRVVVRQETPEEFKVVEAQGLRAEYDGKTEQIEMIGQAVVTRYICGKPMDTIVGERVKYNQNNDTYQAFGGPQSAARGGRVRSVATPAARADAAIAECRQQSGQN